MIDTHGHYLPSVDDGPKTIEMSLEMLLIAQSEGFTDLIMTPHYFVGHYENQLVEEQFLKVKELIAQENLNLRIYLGNEVYISEQTVDAFLNQGQLKNRRIPKGFTLADSRYVLVELPFHQFHPFHEQLLFRLQLAGYQVILAHVERYHYFERSIEKLKGLIDRGMYGQLNAKALIDIKTRKRAFNMIESGLIQLVASDAHDMVRRAPMIQKPYEALVKSFGTQAAKILFEDNPRRIIEDMELLNEGYQRKKWWH